MTDITFTNSPKNTVSVDNTIKHSSSIVESFILSEDGFKILAQSNDGILFGTVIPSGTGWVNIPKT